MHTQGEMGEGFKETNSGIYPKGLNLLPSPLVCVYVKILSILKRKNSGLISHWKMSVSYRGLKLVLCI